MRDILDLFIIKNRDLSNFYLQDDDWLVVNSLIQLLEPFFIVTEILSTSTYPTISDQNSINFKLQEYWEYVNEPTTIGTLLDPRSKTKTFKDINKRDRAIALLHNKMKLYKNVIVENEITRYFAIPVDPNTNLLDWWHYFAANTITKIRCNLKPDTAHAVICLKNWIQQ
ncbi:12087_t:CDS:2, partial [Racocetra persica]